MQAVLQPLLNAFNTFMNYLPSIIGALVVLIVGYIVAKIIQKVITKLLNRMRVDDRLTSGQGGQYVERFSPRGSPARLIGTVVFALIMLLVVTSAIGTLRIPALTTFMNVVLGYIPNLLAALLIFLVAVAIAGAVGGLAHRTMGDTVTGRIVRAVGPTLIMAIAVFMVLVQLQIAFVIVTATYITLIATAGLGAALAFGLGGREAAAEMINSSYRRAQQEQETVRRDLQAGRKRGERDIEQTREYAQQGAGSPRDGDEAARHDRSYRAT